MSVMVLYTGYLGGKMVHEFGAGTKIILELKYAHDQDLNADKIINHFPFRITRSSKYVSGVESF